jgi:hypothetical protein
MEIEIVDADPRRIKSIRIRGLEFDLLLNTKDNAEKNSNDLSVTP